MKELVTHIESWEHRKGDIFLRGKPIERADAVKVNAPHGIVFVLLVKPKTFVKRGKRKTLFYLQRRALDKPLYPGMLTLAASGGISHGESILQAARREVKEELGVRVRHLKILSINPLQLNPERLYHYFFPVIAIAKRLPVPDGLEVEPEGSRYYTAAELLQVLNAGRLTPPASNFFETIKRAGEKAKK